MPLDKIEHEVHTNTTEVYLPKIKKSNLNQIKPLDLNTILQEIQRPVGESLESGKFYRTTDAASSINNCKEKIRESSL